MEQRGCSGSQLARDLGVSQSWVSHASRGEKDTSTANAIRLLASVGWELVIRPKWEESDSVKRRDFHRRVIAVGAASAAEAARSAVFVPSSVANPLQDPVYLRELATRLMHSRREHGGIPLLSRAMNLHRGVMPLIKSRNEDLLVSASELTGAITQVLGDTRRFNAAESTGEFALALAQRANDAEAQGHALRNLSFISLTRGNGELGAMYAQRGLRLPGITPLLQSKLNMCLARSSALVHGQETEARRALDNALSFEALSAFDAANNLGHVGCVLDSLQKYESAYSALDDAVADLAQWSPLLQAQTLTRQIESVLRIPEPYKAADRMLMLGRILPFVSSVRVYEDAHGILKVSKKWEKVPEMRAAREFLRNIAPPTVASNPRNPA